MDWILYSIIASITYCGALEANNHYKIEGKKLNAWRSLLATAMFIPLIGLMAWPDDPKFYLAALFTAAISIYGMRVQYNLAAEKNGRVANLFGPVSIIVAFVLWLVFDQAQLHALLAEPLKLVIISSALLLTAGSVLLIKKNRVGWDALMIILPVGVLYGIYSVVAKLVLDTGMDAIALCLSFIFLSNLMMTLYYLPQILRDSGGEISLKPVLRGGGVIAAFHTASWVFSCLALIATPNPAYPAVISSLSPFWFMLYYRAKGVNDNASPVAGAVLFMASLMIVIVQ